MLRQRPKLMYTECPLKYNSFIHTHLPNQASQVVLVVKNSRTNAEDFRDTGLIPRWGRFHEGGHGNLLQHSCLENAMDRGAWWATVHGVAKSWTQLSMHEPI